MDAEVLIRPIEAADVDDVARMAGQLVRYHHALDPLRFLLIDGVENGYARFFRSQLAEETVVLLVAEQGEHRIGYAYARLESRDWNALLDAHGALHDIFVQPSARGRGVASALLTEVVARLKARGAPRVVLSTAVQNDKAHRLFGRHGFRRTMLEMTCELGPGHPNR